MNQFRAWIQDKKNLPIVVGGLVVILAVVGFVIWRTNAGSAPQAAQIGMPGQPAMPGQPGVPGGPVGPQMPGRPTGMPSAPGAPTAPGMPVGPGATQTGTTPGAPSAAGSPRTPAGKDQQASAVTVPHRADPFALFPVKAPSKTDILIAMLPTVSHIRIAPAPVYHEKNTEFAAAQDEVMPPQPQRRMAGVMLDSKISAILETNGEDDIVTPGTVVTRGGSKVSVESISPDQIVLKTLDTTKPFIIRVNMAGSMSGEGMPGGGPIVPNM